MTGPSEHDPTRGAAGHRGPDPGAGSRGADAYAALTESFGRDLRDAAQARPAPSRRLRPRRPILATGGLLVVATIVAFVLVLGTLRTGDGLLTPQEAVAAAARDLSSDGVLHWKTEMVFRDRDGRRREVPGYDTWIDLKTGARHDRLLGNPVNELGGRGPSQTWYNGSRTRIAIWGPYKKADPRLLVMRTVRRAGEKIPPYENPIDALRKTLALGASGAARVVDAGTIDGRPVAKVTQVEPMDDPSFGIGATITTEMWITREATPRLVRTTTTQTGKYASAYTEEPAVWDLRPRSEDALSHVRPPEFDPAKYVVRTQYLGPPKR